MLIDLVSRSSCGGKVFCSCLASWSLGSFSRNPSPSTLYSALVWRTGTGVVQHQSAARHILWPTKAESSLRGSSRVQKAKKWARWMPLAGPQMLAEYRWLVLCSPQIGSQQTSAVVAVPGEQLLVHLGWWASSSACSHPSIEGNSYCVTHEHTEAGGTSCSGMIENRNRRLMEARNALLGAWKMGFEGSIPHFLLTFLVMFLQTLREMVPKPSSTGITQRFCLITLLSCDDGCKILRNSIYYLTVQSIA